MRILGFAFNKIAIEKQKVPKAQLDLTSNINIEDIKEEKVPFADKPALKFSFVFGVTYGADYAKVEIKGSVLVMAEGNESKEILKDWKNKKFDSPFKIGLYNYILSKCSIKAMNLEEDLGLPLHIPFPQITDQPTMVNVKPAESNKANYTG